ncbi:MAG: lysophospholipid acyltransferase family protein [Candidatus Hydrogenedentes bacterium]|nr:lysophospholipid acyltransferase family protein [Candidatus Hydrogenedentota bacterium]
MKIRHLAGWIPALASVAIIGITRRLPLPAGRFLLVGCAQLAGRILPRIHRVGLENIDLAFGDSLSAAEKKRLLRGAIENMALVAAEFHLLKKLAHLSDEEFAACVTAEGLEHFRAQEGCVLIGGHLGNWEWMAGVINRAGFKIAEVVRPLDNPLLNRVVDEHRNASGAVTIPKDNAGREMLRLLKEGYIVGLLADQSPRDNAVPVTFFGQPCWGTIGAVMIAQRGNVPIYCSSLIRTAPGKYHFRVSPAIEMANTGDRHQDLLITCQRCQDAVEEHIRRAPEQWLWMHRRWKPRPRLEQEWQERTGGKLRKENTGDAPAATGGGSGPS